MEVYLVQSWRLNYSDIDHKTEAVFSTMEMAKDKRDEFVANDVDHNWNYIVETFTVNS